MRFYLMQVLIALDQLLNALRGGWADETLSSAAYRMSLRNDAGVFGWRWSVCAWLINTLAHDPNHCKDAFVSERDNNQLPPEFRGKNAE